MCCINKTELLFFGFPFFLAKWYLPRPRKGHVQTLGTCTWQNYQIVSLDSWFYALILSLKLPLTIFTATRICGLCSIDHFTLAATADVINVIK